MPVNMDPLKKRRRTDPKAVAAQEEAHAADDSPSQKRMFGEETEVDREKDLADAESKNLWDATEVIDMDKV